MNGIESCGLNSCSRSDDQRRAHYALKEGEAHLVDLPVTLQPLMLEQLARGGPLQRILRKAPREKVAELGRAPRRDRRGRVLDDAEHGAHRVQVRVGRLARDELNDCARQGPDVGRGRGADERDDFGCH